MEENRIEAGIREWRNHEKKLTEIFGDSIKGHRDLAKAQLSHYREVMKRPMDGMTKDEKVMRSILRGEIGRMEKAYYPLLIARIARSIGRAFEKNKHVVSDGALPAQLVIQPQLVTKRNVAPVRQRDQKQKVQHNLLQKKRQNHSKGIKR